VARTLYVRVAQRQEAIGTNLSSTAAYKLMKGSKEGPLVPTQPGSRVPRDGVRATRDQDGERFMCIPVSVAYWREQSPACNATNVAHKKIPPNRGRLVGGDIGYEMIILGRYSNAKRQLQA